MNSGRQRWWKKPGAMVALTVVGILLFGLIVYKVSSSLGVKRELEAIRKRGLPTTRVELDAWYERVPVSENAALVFMEAGGHQVAPSSDNDPGQFNWRDLPLGEPLPSNITAAAEDYIRKNEVTLRKLHEGALLSRSRYPVDLAAKNFALRHLISLKSMANLLRWEAVLRAEKGDAAGAVQSIKSGFALARTLSEEPIILSHLVRSAILSIQFYGLERVVNAQGFEEAELAELAEAVRKAEADGKRGLFRALAGERAYGMNSYDMGFQEYQQMITWGGTLPPSGEVSQVVQELLFNLRRAVGLQESDLRFYMRGMGRLLHAAELEHPEMLRASEVASSEIAAELNEHPVRYLLSKQVLPAMLRVNEKEALLAARLRCAAMALEIERFRARNGGRLPRLVELVPGVFKELPRDPADGKPIEYRVNEAKGYRIVAVGSTMEERKGRTSTNVPDVGFTVRR